MRPATMNRLYADLRELAREPAITVNLMRDRTAHNEPFFARLVDDFHREVRRRHPRFPLVRRLRHGVATCVLPTSFQEYFRQIEASARRNFKKASRSGFTFSRIDYNQHLEDVKRIRHSSEYRQGKLPDRILNKVIVPSTNPPSRSADHDYPYFGVLREGKLFAYAGCLVAGEVCIIETIYGDAAVQPEGVVPMLIISIAEHLLTHHPAVKYYCYGTYFGAREEMRRFKRKFLFLPHRVDWRLSAAAGADFRPVGAAADVPPASAGAYTVRTYSGREAVGSLARPLEAAGMLPAPLLGMDPEYLGDGREGAFPQALVAWRGQRPVAYLPFVVRQSSLPVRIAPRRAAALPYRQLRLLGYQAAAHEPDSLAADLLEQVCAVAGRYHLGIAAEIPIDDPLAKAMSRRQPRGARQALVRWTRYNSYRVDVAGTFDDFLRERFNPKSRSTLRRKVRRLSAEFKNVEARLFTREESVSEFLRDAERVARQTYQWRQGLPVIRNSADQEATLRHLARRGLWRSYILYADDEPCAYCHGSTYGRVYDYDVLGYSARFANLSPGIALLYHILEDLFAAGVVDELNFGAGAAEYKRRFATRDACVLYAKLYAPGAYPALLRAAESSSDALVAAAKSVLGRVRSLPGSRPAAAIIDEVQVSR